MQASLDRMISYWEARSDLFGEEGMLQSMNKSGCLKPGDAAALDQGVVQFLPQRDLEGRALLYYDPSRHNKKCSSESTVSII